VDDFNSTMATMRALGSGSGGEPSTKNLLANSLLPVACFFVGIVIIVLFALAFTGGDGYP